MSRHFLISLSLLLIAGIIAGAAPKASKATASKNAPRKRDGDYVVTIAGYAKGTGTAALTADAVTISGTVVDSSGNKGALNVSAPVTGDHFTGTGTMLGMSVTIRGRIDAPDLDLETALKLSRIVGTIRTSSGQYVKILGELPGSGKPTAPVNPNPGPNPPGTPNPGPNPPGKGPGKMPPDHSDGEHHGGPRSRH